MVMMKREETKSRMSSRRQSGERLKSPTKMKNTLILYQNRGVKTVEWNLKCRDCRADQKCLLNKKERSTKQQATRVIGHGANIAWQQEHGDSITVVPTR